LTSQSQIYVIPKMILFGSVLSPYWSLQYSRSLGMRFCIPITWIYTPSKNSYLNWIYIYRHSVFTAEWLNMTRFCLIEVINGWQSRDGMLIVFIISLKVLSVEFKLMVYLIFIKTFRVLVIYCKVITLMQLLN